MLFQHSNGCAPGNPQPTSYQLLKSEDILSKILMKISLFTNRPESA